MRWTVTKSFTFCAGHRLLNYPGLCRFLHGHLFKVEIHITKSTLDDCGMVLDFNEIRDGTKGWIDSVWDHGFLVNEYDLTLLDFLKSNGQRYYPLLWSEMEVAHGRRGLDTSESRRVSLCNPTVENLGALLQYRVCSLLSIEPGYLTITLYESPSGWVTVS